MIKRLYFSSMDDAQSGEYDKSFAIVSILDPATEKSCLSIEESNVLRVNFLDLDRNDFEQFKIDDESISDGVVFNESYARDIVEFVLKKSKEGVENILVHCRLGSSRSAAVALALDELLFKFGCKDWYFEFPNKLEATGANRYVLEVFNGLYSLNVSPPSKDDVMESGFYWSKKMYPFIR